ncbi:hypothetical protein SAMN04487988_10431 [Algoriphagus hitonicola]|uniref:Uncharacterized protein n=1 Tax=Algoriphagus hitonicola TaxID=435880 RepID=A0A1I2S5X3_9BACT|nr:hypothetical protein SAMN04487988_10431 [Algoriphagus hitonicola]
MLKLADKPSCLGGGDHRIKHFSELVNLPNYSVEVRILLLQQVILGLLLID